MFDSSVRERVARDRPLQPHSIEQRELDGDVLGVSGLCCRARCRGVSIRPP